MGKQALEMLVPQDMALECMKLIAGALANSTPISDLSVPTETSVDSK